MPMPDNALHCMLQLGRPLSGAVTTTSGVWTSPAVSLQLGRPLSGAVTPKHKYRGQLWLPRFNWAAPFRERLQSPRKRFNPRKRLLQLGRPLSGAVTYYHHCPDDLRTGASIGPPPFGSGYGTRRPTTAGTSAASIGPPPFGSGYCSVLVIRCAWAVASIGPPPFGSGYKAQSPRPPSDSLASIGPPPFGSGYLHP